MSVGTASAPVGSIDGGGSPGIRGVGPQWWGLIAGLIVLALLAVASVVSTPTAPRAAGGTEPGATGPVSAAQALALTQPGVPGSAGLSQATRERALDAYGKLPLSFVPNAGQTDPSVRYSAQGAGFGFYFTPDKAVLAFQKGERGQALDLRFVGANPNPELVADGRREGTVNYLVGSEHHANLPTYDQVVYRELWPGIDMVFRGQGGTLKYEFHLAPGADPSDIRLAYHGAEGVSLGAGGTLLVNTGLGRLTDERPQSFQRIDGRRVPVESRYALTGSSYGFAVGHHDRRRPLVIDPGLAYSTYLGGSGSDLGRAVAVDSAGNAYVTGQTASTDFPTTPGAFDTSANGGFDAFVTKLNTAGSGLVYSTYLGGSGFEFGTGVALDGAGAAYVTGATDSADFPTTLGAFDTSFNGGFSDAFVTKLNSTGSGLLYSTYLGGSLLDEGDGVVVDSGGNAYVTGPTASANFPTTLGAFDTTLGGSADAFVTKLNAAGSGLVYSTFLGGTFSDLGLGVAIDSLGAAYVTGQTFSADFPTTPGAFDTTDNGVVGSNSDAFVTKLNPTGSGLAYSTYLGGTGFDTGLGVAVDSGGNAYVTGATDSANFPTTLGAVDTSFNGGGRDAFVTKLNAAGSGLVYSTYLGGSSTDVSRGVAVDSAGAAYVTGQTSSADFPTTLGASDTSFNGGGSDAFVTKLNAAGSSLADSTFLGGSGFDAGFGVAVDSAGAAYVTGQTSSANFPTTLGAFDTSFNGGGDAFVTKLTFGPGAPATLTLAPPADTNDVDTEHCVTATVKDGAGDPTPGIIVRFTVTGSVTTSGSDTTDANGEATFCYQGPELPGADAIDAFADTDNDETQDPGEPSGAATKAWTLPVTTPLCQVTIDDGGRITANNGDKATFGGNAQSDAAGHVKGQQQYRDQGPAQPQKVKSIEILALTCNPQRTQATIFGRATIDGQGSHLFRIDVQDLGEPGRGQDTYRILLDTGYDSGSHTLEGGNVQIH